MRPNAVPLLLAALALAACGKPAPAPAPKVDLVARVNGEGITRAQLDAAFASESARLPTRGERPVLDERAKEAALRRLVDDTLVEQKARELGVAIAPEAIQAREAAYRARFATPEALAEYFERTRSTPAELASQLRRELLEEGIAAKAGVPVEVTDEEIARAYEAGRARHVEKERIRASRVVVRVAEDADAAQQRAAREKARALHARASQRATDFAQLARSSSEGPESASGGEMGWVERGEQPAGFEAAAFALSAGGLSRVYRGRLGYEFVKVWEKLPRRTRTLEQAAPEIREEIATRRRDERRRDALAEMRRSARVEQLGHL